MGSSIVDVIADAFAAKFCDPDLFVPREPDPSNSRRFKFVDDNLVLSRTRIIFAARECKITIMSNFLDESNVGNITELAHELDKRIATFDPSIQESIYTDEKIISDVSISVAAIRNGATLTGDGTFYFGGLAGPPVR
jgi:hypothetical protein